MIRYFLTLCCIFIIGSESQAQSSKVKPVKADSNSSLPFKVLTAGKKITIQSTQNILKIIAWGSSGNRIVEQKDVNLPRFSFTPPGGDRIIFILLEFPNGKRYTHKIGLQ